MGHVGLHGPSPLCYSSRLCLESSSFHKFASYLASPLGSQIYADDFLAYQHCLPAGASANVRAKTMSIALEALGTWMLSNRFRFNSPNIQFIWLSYFYSASSNSLLIRGVPDTTRILCRSSR